MNLITQEELYDVTISYQDAAQKDKKMKVILGLFSEEKKSYYRFGLKNEENKIVWNYYPATLYFNGLSDAQRKNIVDGLDKNYNEKNNLKALGVLKTIIDGIQDKEKNIRDNEKLEVKDLSSASNYVLLYSTNKDLAGSQNVKIPEYSDNKLSDVRKKNPRKVLLQMTETESKAVPEVIRKPVNLLYNVVAAPTNFALNSTRKLFGTQRKRWQNFASTKDHYVDTYVEVDEQEIPFYLSALKRKNSELKNMDVIVKHNDRFYAKSEKSYHLRNKDTRFEDIFGPLKDSVIDENKNIKQGRNFSFRFPIDEKAISNFKEIISSGKLSNFYRKTPNLKAALQDKIKHNSDGFYYFADNDNYCISKDGNIWDVSRDPTIDLTARYESPKYYGKYCEAMLLLRDAIKYACDKCQENVNNRKENITNRESTIIKDWAELYQYTAGLATRVGGGGDFIIGGQNPVQWNSGVSFELDSKSEKNEKKSETERERKRDTFSDRYSRFNNNNNEYTPEQKINLCKNALYIAAENAGADQRDLNIFLNVISNSKKGWVGDTSEAIKNFYKTENEKQSAEQRIQKISRTFQDICKSCGLYSSQGLGNKIGYHSKEFVTQLNKAGLENIVKDYPKAKIDQIFEDIKEIAEQKTNTIISKKLSRNGQQYITFDDQNRSRI